MRINILYVIGVSLCLLVACNNKEKTEDSLFPDLNYTQNISKNTALSTFFPNYRLIKLETNDSCLIGNTSKVLKSNHHYYVNTDDKIFKFSDTGVFLSKLASKGMGPQDYAKICGFDIVKYDNQEEIWIATFGGLKIYNADNFEFKREIKTDLKVVNEFKYLEEEKLIFARIPEDKMFAIFDETGKVLNRFEEKDLANSLQKKFPFLKHNNSWIYQIDNTNQGITYDLSTGKMQEVNLLPATENVLSIAANREVYDTYGYFEQTIETQKRYDLLNAIRLIGNTTLLQMRHSDFNSITLLKNGKTKTLKYEPKAEISNDIIPTENLLFLSTAGSCNSDDSFLFFIPAEFINYHDKIKMASDSNDYLPSMMMDDNFVLLEVF